MLCPLSLVKAMILSPSSPSFSLCLGLSPRAAFTESCTWPPFLSRKLEHLAPAPLQFNTLPNFLTLPYLPSYTPHRAHFQILHSLLFLHFCSPSTCGLMPLHFPLLTLQSCFMPFFLQLLRDVYLFSVEQTTHTHTQQSELIQNAEKKGCEYCRFHRESTPPNATLFCFQPFICLS